MTVTLYVFQALLELERGLPSPAEMQVPSQFTATWGSCRCGQPQRRPAPPSGILKSKAGISHQECSHAHHPGRDQEGSVWTIYLPVCHYISTELSAPSEALKLDDRLEQRRQRKEGESMSSRHTTVPQKSPSVTVADDMLCFFHLFTLVQSGNLSVSQYFFALRLTTKLPVCPCLNGNIEFSL